MLISISDAPDNERGPHHTQPILAAMHHALTRAKSASLLFARDTDRAGLYCRFPDELDQLVRGQFHANYPDCHIDLLPDDALGPPPGFSTWTVRLELQPDIFPILRYQQFADAIIADVADPASGILQTLAGHNSLRPSIELRIRPSSARRRRHATKIVRQLTRPFFRSHHRLARRYAWMASSSRWWQRRGAAVVALLFAWHPEQRSYDDELTKTSSRLHDNEKDLQAAAVKLGHHLFETHLILTVHAPREASALAASKLREIAAVFNKFTVPRLSTFATSPIQFGDWQVSRRRGFIFSDEELATIFHLPTKHIGDASVRTTPFRRFEPPAELPLKERERDICELGRISFRDRSERFGIRSEDRLLHSLVIGKTGVGKSSVLYNAIVSDMAAGHGLAVVDPHGDLADAILAAVPSARTNDVLLIDPSDLEYAVSINPLDVPAAMSDVACDGMVSTFRKVFGTGSHTPRLEDILWNTLLALMLAGDATLLDMLRMFGSDDNFRRNVLLRVHDPLVSHWWMTTFPKLRALKGEDPFASLENKLRQLLTNQVIRNMVCQRQSRVDFRHSIDTQKIVIVNLSKGRLGERTSSFLGSLVVTQLQLAAMSRANIAEADRQSFYLYVDEFHNVATSSFQMILSEARKFKFGLCLATQYLDQVDLPTLQAVFGNIGSMLVFAVGPNDAEILAEQLTGGVEATDLIALSKYNAYVRLMIDGVSRPAFSMETIPPAIVTDQQRAEIVRNVSRRRYAQPAGKVQAGVHKALSVV